MSCPTRLVRWGIGGSLLCVVLLGSQWSANRATAQTTANARKNAVHRNNGGASRAPRRLDVDAETAGRMRQLLATRSGRLPHVGPANQSRTRLVARHFIEDGPSIAEYEEIEGELVPELSQPLPEQGVVFDGYDQCDECGEDCVGRCDHGLHAAVFGPGPCFSRCLIPFPHMGIDNFSFNLGVHGSKGPANRAGDASFGFQQGFNWGVPIRRLDCWGISSQIGFQAEQSNFANATFTDESREQLFLTAGLFRRVDSGLQAGVALDYMRDDWYYTIKLAQIRAELSCVFFTSHEIGFSTAFSNRDDTSTSVFSNGANPIAEVWETTDQYTFFYRRQFDPCTGSEGRLFAGFTGDSEGLLGGDVNVPISDHWAIQAEFVYLVPEEAPARIANTDEAWNVAMNLVWYPKGTAQCGGYNRPLFNVAGNGSMLVDRR